MENAKLNAFKQYAHDYIGDITVTQDRDLIKGSNGCYYKVLTADDVDAERIQYSESLADNILQEVITLCNTHGLENITSLLTIDKDTLNDDLDNTPLEDILGVQEVLDDEYNWQDDDGFHCYTICRVI